MKKNMNLFELFGKHKEGSIYRFDVSIDQLNECGANGWNFAYTTNNGHTVVMVRETQ